MAKKRKPTITVRPVAWNGEGKVLKYQALAELDGVKVYSDPSPTEKSARLSLLKKCKSFGRLAKQVAEIMSEAKSEAK